MKIAGVVVLYEPTKEDLENILTYVNEVDMLYVMDNSKVETSLLSLSDYKNIQYLFLNENKGIASALNIAAKKAREDGFLWLLTMDQDSRFNKDLCKEFFLKIKQNQQDRVAIYTPWHQTQLKDQAPKERIDYPLQIMTSGNVVSLEILEKLGGFYEWYFIDAIDMDYCYRLQKENYRIMRFNDVQMNHELGDTQYHKFMGHEILLNHYNYRRRYYIARNYLYLKKLYSDIDPIGCKNNAKMRRWMVKIFLFEKDKFRKLLSIVEGKIDYYRGVKGRRWSD